MRTACSDYGPAWYTDIRAGSNPLLHIVELSPAGHQSGPRGEGRKRVGENVSACTREYRLCSTQQLRQSSSCRGQLRSEEEDSCPVLHSDPSLAGPMSRVRTIVKQFQFSD